MIKIGKKERFSKIRNIRKIRSMRYEACNSIQCRSDDSPAESSHISIYKPFWFHQPSLLLHFLLKYISKIVYAH